MPFGKNAAGGNIRPIPVTTTNPNAASESLGWPPSTFTPEGAGGVPPDGRDMNGLDNQLSAWALWYSIGGPVVYDSVQQAAIGGYPQYAIVGSVLTPGTFWQSTTDNNVTDPDASGAGWVSWPSSAAVPWSAPPPIGNVTPNTGAFSSAEITGRMRSNDIYTFSDILCNGSVNTSGVVNAGSDLQINGVGFTHAFGTSGYQRLPTGLLIQWGRLNTPTGNGDVITFPIQFQTFCTLATDVGNDGSGAPFIVNGSLGSAPFSSFTCWTFKNGVVTPAGIGWIAIGI